jgi:hypothetical protein
MADMMYFMNQNKKKEEVKKKERAEKEKLKVSSELLNVLNIFCADCRHPIRKQKYKQLSEYILSWRWSSL